MARRNSPLKSADLPLFEGRETPDAPQIRWDWAGAPAVNGWWNTVLAADVRRALEDPEREQYALHRHPGGVPIAHVEPRDTPEIAIFLDTETTGPSQDTGELIELALIRVEIDRKTGAIVAQRDARNWLQEPSQAIPAEISALTGLHDEDVRGRHIPVDEAMALLGSAHWIIAHNAGFDRGFLAKKLPARAELPGRWVCSLEDISWSRHGMHSRRLAMLALQHGFVYKGHRAQVDVEVLATLLGFPVFDAREPVHTYLWEALENASQTRYRVAACETHIATKDHWKRLGMRWNPAAKHWYHTARNAEEAERRAREIARAIAELGDQGKVRIGAIAPEQRFEAQARTRWSDWRDAAAAGKAP